MANAPRLLGRGAVLSALVLACACSDRHPLATSPVPPEALASAVCEADVRAGVVTCSPPVQPVSRGARLDRYVGGQEVYIRLASTSTSYDAATQVFQTTVTVQNLMRAAIGTTDGTTVTGVRVFFQTEPTVSGSGSGTISIINEDGSDLFLRADQPYFRYPELLTPYQVSQPRSWQFSVPPTVDRFRFTVYVAAPMVDETATSLLDRVWTGLAGTNWFDGGSWKDGAAPDSASAVSVPADSLLASDSLPVLSADARVLHLRIGTGSTLGLGGFTLRADGNVDAVGSIGADGGTLWMSGTGTLLQGSVGALRVTGGTRLQGATRATGAVTVTNGSLTTNSQPLSISIP